MFDIKMYLYILGACMIALNILSALSLVYNASQQRPSLALSTYSIIFFFFLCEYSYFEEVHLYTYDLFCERVGFKLWWGCCVWYPFFYTTGMWCMVDPNLVKDISPMTAGAIGVMYLIGWLFTRGANLQKFAFKTNPKQKHCLFGLVEQKALPGSNGKILISGFWAIARHSNYLGEIIQGFALALPGLLSTGSLLPLAYPIYYVLLFIFRAIDDDVSCAIKYGKLWRQYQEKVPYRILPYVF